MALLDYTKDDSRTNSGDTYADVQNETGTYGPVGGVFARFRQDGEGYVNLGDDAGQLYRWCEKLNALKFGGRTNWRRATKDELVGLYNDVGGSLWDTRGWPIYYIYSTTTVIGVSHYYQGVSFKDGRSYTDYPDDPFYASCVSNP